MGWTTLTPLRLTVRNIVTGRITMSILFLGIDLAKNVFQLCGLNRAGKPVYTKRTGRKIAQTLAKYSCMSDWDRRPQGILLLAA